MSFFLGTNIHQMHCSCVLTSIIVFMKCLEIYLLVHLIETALMHSKVCIRIFAIYSSWLLCLLIWMNIIRVSASIPLKGGLNAMDVLVMDLPYSNSKTQAAIKNRLKHLSENAGGKVITLQGKFALLRFPNKEAALRYVN